MKRLIGLLPLLTLGLGCAAANPALLGHVNGVAVVPQRVFSSRLDLEVEPDGCVRGDLMQQALQLCPTEVRPGLQRWNGGGITLFTEVSADGRTLSTSGFGGPFNRFQSQVVFGEGPLWSELRRNPVLLAMTRLPAWVPIVRTTNRRARR